MADKTITQLPLITDLSLDDIIPAVQEGMARHAPLSALLALMFNNISTVTLPTETLQVSFRGSGADPNVALSRNNAHVFAIGQLVYIRSRVTWDGLSGGSGDLQLHLSDSDYAPASSWDGLNCRIQGLSMFDIDESAETMDVRADNGYFTISVGRGRYSGSSAAIGDLQSSGDMTFNGWYRR